MEVVAGDLPFQRRNVVEWSHRDRLTGALERARRETNHWSASSANAIHNYNKVVDQRALNLPDGRVQQTQRKQVEVFSTQVPGGSLQVFRSSTTSSSRSSFQFTQMGTGTWSAIPAVPDVDTAFGDLQLALHPLDLSSEKTKASVGRSIGWRRPPSRVTRTAAAKTAAKETHVEITVEDDKPADSGPIISFPSDDDSSEKTEKSSSRHSIVESRKSCSSENLVKVGVDGDGLSADDGVAANGFLGRSSVLRRSLQYTRPPDFPTGTSVRKMREEIESRGVHVVPLSPSATLQRQSPVSAAPKEQTLDKVKRLVSDSITTQNHSFVTVKSLNEVRGRLRSKAADAARAADGEEVAVGEPPAEEAVARRHKESGAPRVQSYVFGMERVANGDSSTNGDDHKLSANANGVRSEEWYRRRKSYGFEPDLTPQSQDVVSLKESKEDTWSDSGTFRSAISFSVSPLLKHIDAIKRSKDAVNKTIRPASLYEGAANGGETALVFKDDAVENGLFKPARIADELAPPQRTVVSLVGEDSDMGRRRDFLRRRAERGDKQGLSVNIPVVADDGEDDKPDRHEPALLINGFHHNPEVKRHSIAVVEAVDEDDAVKLDSALKHGDHLGHLSDSAEDTASQARKKKVEFSKTEVHFAAEPGRFNLVSTDDKPPPTNIVRGRRRQKLLAEQRINRSGLPEVRFGDSAYEKQALAALPAEDRAAPPAPPPAVITVTMEGKVSPDHPSERAADEGVVRCTVSSDAAESAAAGRVPMWRSTVTLKNNSFGGPTANEHSASEGEAEFRRLLKSLRPTGRRDVSSTDAIPDVSVTSSQPPTVRSKGYSTTVNLGSGLASHTGAFVSHHPLSHDSPEHKSILHSLNLSQLGLESTPLVLLANSRHNRSAGGGRPRRPRPRVPRVPRVPPLLIPGVEDPDAELSDDSLQADAEVRAYMVEKSALALLGVSPASPDLDGASPRPSPSPKPSPPPHPAFIGVVSGERQQPLQSQLPGPGPGGALSYRHHASKAERLVQYDESAASTRTASPSSVYVFPEQRKPGCTALPRSEFRTPSPVQMPKSFSLVDSVARRVDAASQPADGPRDSRDGEVRTVSVRDILSRLSEDRSEQQQERIIEVVIPDAVPVVPANASPADCERVNGSAARLTTDSVIFRDYRPTSPRDLSAPLAVRGGFDRDRADRGAAKEAHVRPMAAVAARVADDAEHITAETSRTSRRPRRGSPLVVSADLRDPVEAREFLHTRAPPGGHHIDVVEKFLRSERSHHDERPADVPRQHRDRGDAERRRHRRSHSKEAERHWGRGPGPEQQADARREAVFDEPRGEERRRRSRSRNGHELHGEERRRRSRSRDELHSEERRQRSRSRDELHTEERRRRSRSRDELDSEEQRRRSRSRDDVRRDEEHRRRSRSRDELDKRVKRGGAEHRSEHRAERSRSRSQDELLDDHRRRRRSRSRDELGRDPRHRERDVLEVTNHQSSRSRSRCRKEADRKELVADVNGDVPSRGKHADAAPERRHRDLRDAVEAKPGDRKRPEVGTERPPEAAERRHRCKCAERAGATAADAAKSRPADREKGCRAPAAERAGSRGGAGGAGGAAGAGDARRARPAADKAEKTVRKTRTHVAAMSSPLVQLVRPSRDRRQNDTKKNGAGDVHIVMEPIRPVRRAVPGKQFGSTPVSATVKSCSKLPVQKRPSGATSDSNSSLSQGKASALNHPERERPARRNHRYKHATES